MMTSGHLAYLLSSVAWFLLGVAVTRTWEWMSDRRAETREGVPRRETRLDRVTYTLVVLMFFSAVAFSISTNIRAEDTNSDARRTADCINKVLEERQDLPSHKTDAQANLELVTAVSDAFARRITQADLQETVDATRDVLMANENYRRQHPLGRC